MQAQMVLINSEHSRAEREMYVLCGYICCKENCPWFFLVRKYKEGREGREQDHAGKDEADTRAAYVADVCQREEQREGRETGEPNSFPGTSVTSERRDLLCQGSRALSGYLFYGHLPWNLDVTPQLH